MKNKRNIIEFIIDNFKVYSGFKDYDEAENFAQKMNGELTEIVFRKQETIPSFSDKAKLILNKLPFNFELISKYHLFYSNDEFFDDYQPKQEEKSIILNEDYQVSSQLKQKLKTMKNGNFYEIAVKVLN